MKVNVIDSTNQCYVGQLTSASSNFIFDALGVLLLVTPNPTHTYESKDLIMDGKVSDTGDRPCLHAKLEGELLVVAPSLMTKTTSIIRINDDVETAANAYSYDYYNSGRWKTRQLCGVVCVNGRLLCGIDVRTDDYYCQSRKQYVRNAFYTVEQSGENQIFSHFHYEHRANLTDPWSVRDYPNYYTIDVVNRKYRINNGSWTSLSPLRKSSLPPPTTPVTLPTTWLEYAKFFGKLKMDFSMPSKPLIYGDLVRRCANDAQVISSNSLELVRELRNLSETLKGVLDLRKGRIDLKKISSAYLSYKYGPILTAKDIKSITEELAHELQRTSSAVGRVRAKEKIFLPSNEGAPYGLLELEYNYKITHWKTSSKEREFIRSWYDSGLFPSLQNLWDFVPLSFTVDWLTKTNQYLDIVDASLYLRTYDIIGVTYSEKQIYPDVSNYFYSDSATFVGDVSATRYERRTSPHVHQASYFESTPRDFKNYAELSALIVVLSRK